ncbi:hypothetical protein PIROE2DRAFT_59136 [Piromyces sp. E2]|nr:hypothetical protein PIROE2DRAFT_59136 [Piromyces sp. E2]|eukprot:OUM66776.1 hypothetical protein PIROE2DRAFT_59136 [Piromyces sp. E2]
MSDLMTIGDDESTFSNSQVVSVNGEEEKEYRPLTSRLSEVDETAINSPSLKPTSPFSINSNFKKLDNMSEDDSLKSPDKKKDSLKNKKKGKEKLSPDGKGFLSHMKNFLDESKFKFEKGSLDSLESPTADKKALTRASRKYKSKDSILCETPNDVNIYGSYNSINNSDNEGPVRPRSRSKKLSLHDNLLFSNSQFSMERTGEDDSTIRNRENTGSSSLLTNDNSFIAETNDTLHVESRNSDTIKEHEEENDDDCGGVEKRKNSGNSGRRNGQGNIIIDKHHINNIINNNNLKRDKESEMYLREGYDWVVKEIQHVSHINNINNINNEEDDDEEETV